MLVAEYAAANLQGGFELRPRLPKQPEAKIRPSQGRADGRLELRLVGVIRVQTSCRAVQDIDDLDIARDLSHLLRAVRVRSRQQALEKFVDRVGDFSLALGVIAGPLRQLALV